MLVSLLQVFDVRASEWKRGGGERKFCCSTCEEKEEGSVVFVVLTLKTKKRSVVKPREKRSFRGEACFCFLSSLSSSR